MQDDFAALLAGVCDGEDRVSSTDDAFISNLTAGLGIEWGSLKHHHAFLACFQLPNGFTAFQQSQHFGLFAQMGVTGKYAMRVKLHILGIIGGELTGGTGLLALPLHGIFKSDRINAKVLLASNVGGQVQRKTISIVKLEGRIAGYHVTLKFLNAMVQNFHALVQSLGETLFFFQQHPHDHRLRLGQFRVGFTHLVAQGSDQLMEKGITQT